MKRPVRWRSPFGAGLAAGLATLGLLGLASELIGRAGGGGGYNPGGGSGGGGGGGSGIMIDVIWFLIRLIFIRPAIGIPVAILVLGIAYYVYTKGDSVWNKVDTDTDWENHEAPPVQSRTQTSGEMDKLRQRDPAFDQAAFARRVREAFLRIQKHWSDGGMKNIRPLVTDGVQERFEILLEINKRCQIRNILRNVEVRGVQVRAVRSDAFFDTIEVKIEASAVDYYVKAGTEQVVHGRKEPEPFAEYWSFIRRPSVKTKAGAKGLAEGHCPSCAAPLKISDRGACDYCKAVVNSGSYDWVLAEITQTRAAAGERQVQGLEALSAKDPGFNTQYAEDRASVIFWRLRMSEVMGSPKIIEGVAAPGFLTAKAKKWERLDDGGSRFYADAAVGAVDVVGVSCDPDGMDRMRVRVKWSGREVKVKLPALVKPSFGNTMSFDQEFVLVRGAATKSAALTTFSARSCASCGAAETRTGGGKCARCGITLNNGELDWVLDDVAAFGTAGYGGAAAAATATAVGGGREPGTEDALAAAIGLVKAKGHLKAPEYALLLNFAQSRGITTEALDRIIARVQNGEVPASLRFVNKGQKKNFLLFMLKLCIADGEISAEEEEFMLRLGQKLQVTELDLPAEIAKARKALQKSVSSGRLVS